MLDRVKTEIASIKERNTKVEADKAWEVSWFRKLSIAILTYIVVVLFFVSASVSMPLLNALVPTLWFLLSTLSLDFLKKIWLRCFVRK